MQRGVAAGHCLAISPLSPSSSLFPSAQVLSSILSHPQFILQAVARGHGGGCCTIYHHHGGGRLGMAVSTRSTLQTSACSSGRQVLGAVSILSVSLSPFHLRFSPLAVAREDGGGQCIVSRRCRVVCRQSPVLVSSVVPTAVLSPTNDPPHEQLLVRLGWVVWSLGRHRLVAPSNPPYKQLLVGLGVGARLMFHTGGRCRVSVTWH